ncbi:MAG: aspartate aminotransferase family protein [Solirubrobacterales bacterium]
MSVSELQDLERRWAVPTYARLPVEFVEGRGAELFDADGRRYLDFLAGISVLNVGHCHPRVVEAVRDQVGRLTHVSNLFYNEPGLRLSERLSRSSLGGKVFLSNSGAEANEAAIKLARRHAVRRGIAEPEIVVLTGAFHGRTLGALAATPKMSRPDLFGPMLPGFVAVERDDPRALAAAVGDRTAAVMLEPIQGESGIWPLADEVIEAAERACREAGALLVFDEIQCGMGRTGTLWAYEQLGVTPDVLTSAKGLGGGLPLGAMVTSPEMGEVLGAGEHGSTFAGGPLVSVAGLAAFDVLDDPALLARVTALGERLREGLGAMPGVREVRGRGLMVAAAVDRAAPQLVRDLAQAGLIVNAPAPETLRFLPPLTVSDAELDEALEILGAALG